MVPALVLPATVSLMDTAVAKVGLVPGLRTQLEQRAQVDLRVGTLAPAEGADRAPEQERVEGILREAGHRRQPEARALLTDPAQKG